MAAVFSHVGLCVFDADRGETGGTIHVSVLGATKTSPAEWRARDGSASTGPV